MKLVVYTLILFFSAIISTRAHVGGFAESIDYVLSGHVIDAETGETLIGANVFVRDLQRGSTSNFYGFYSLSLPHGEYLIECSFIGYTSFATRVNLHSNQTLDIILEPMAKSLQEVRVTAHATHTRIEEPLMGVTRLQSQTIKSLPAFAGETDVIKVIQMLPGVQAASEGSSGFTVRGGNPDQNLVLLDEATIYNAGHLLGFFSLFNNDAIKDVALYKGDIPARNGGRLASVLDVRMKDGNSKRITGTGGLGIISSRLMFEGPIASENTTFIATGRRTYADLFLPLAADENIRNNTLYFYDLNAKVTHRFGEKDRLFISAYHGRDKFGDKDFMMSYGNVTLTTRWNRIYSPRLFSNFTFVFSNYDYSLGNTAVSDGFSWESDLSDRSFKADFNYYPNSDHSLTFGLQLTHHSMLPANIKGTGSGTQHFQIRQPVNHSLEHAAYIENQHIVSSHLTLRYGARLSALQNIGKARSFIYDGQYNIIDTLYHQKGEIYNTYIGLEPRLGFTWLLSNDLALKGAYSKTHQYLHLASGSSASSPLDVWFSSSLHVKPQISDQFSMGLLQHLKKGTIEVSLESFYKNIQNSIDFKDHHQLLLNDKIEAELRFGKSYAYGVEFMTRFDNNRWNGWISYTWSQSKRKTDMVNDNQWYHSPYDRPHDFSIVGNYRISERISLSCNWVYLTGTPATFPVGRFEFMNNIIPVYSKRNAERMPDYHRLDLSISIKSKPKRGLLQEGEWVFAVYNAYARKNAWIINFEQREHYNAQAVKLYLFSVVPSVTYNFKF